MKIPSKYNAGSPPPPGVHPGHWEIRSFYVADRLSDLTGPTVEDLTLPLRLNWSTTEPTSLANEKHVSSTYAAVLREATSEADLIEFVNAELLVRLWPVISLPLVVREAWNVRFPELSA